MEYNNLREYLTELDSGFAAQSQEWNREFNRVWDKSLGSLKQAIASASQTSSDVIREQLHRRLNELCSLYLDGSPEQRENIRALAGQHKHVLRAMCWHIGWAAGRMESPTDLVWLRSGLAAASIEDNRIDFRDMYLALGHLYLAAARIGIDPMSFFKEVGRMSSSQPSQLAKAFKSGSMQNFLSEFDRSAFFQESVKPRLHPGLAPTARNLIEKHSVRKVNFLSEQDGTPERELKTRLSRAFEATPGIWRGYLAQIDYGDPSQQNVALCLIAAPGLEKDIVEQVGSVFRSLFNEEEHLDILFPSPQQEAELSLVCRPFYVTKAKARN